MTEAYNELLTVVNGLRRDLATEQTMHTAWRKRAEEAEATIEQARPRIADLEAERDALKAAIAVAYGHLWHINNEPLAPIPIYTPQKAAYAARKALRELLTSEERGDAINAAQRVWGVSIDAAKGE